MKRIFLGATAFAALLFSSCGKNDNASTDLTGAWQLESFTVAGQPPTPNDCQKKSVYVFTQNQLTSHDFNKNEGTGHCEYDKTVETYKIEGNLIKDANDPNGKGIPFSISGNTLTLTIEENGQKETLNLKKINQAELDAILATINNGGSNNNGGGNNNNGGNNNGGGNSNTGKTIANLDGIWQVVSVIENDVIETLGDCQKKISMKITGNQALLYEFEEETGVCRYKTDREVFTILNETTIEIEGTRIFVSITGDNLTLTTVKNARRNITVYKRITQAQLDALLR